MLLQIGFTSLLLALIFFSLSVLYDEVLTLLISSIAGAVLRENPLPLDSVGIAENLEYTKQRLEVLAATGALILAAVFGYLMTRFALTPTRNALESQKQFVGNIAHELRTPLSIIKTNTEVALFNANLDQDTKETLESNVEELDRISNIINNLLSMNRLLRPEKIAFTNVDIKAVLDRVVHNLSEFAEQKRITLTITSGTQGVVWGNTAALEQICMNVVKNALNYTPERGTVSLAYGPSSPEVIEVIVTDTGMGIDEKDLEHIFEPFYRGDYSRNRKSGGGSGLGLAIVSELVKLHKGSITISSTEGEGTAVTIALPVGRPEKNKSEKGKNLFERDFS